MLEKQDPSTVRQKLNLHVLDTQIKTLQLAGNPLPQFLMIAVEVDHG